MKEMLEGLRVLASLLLFIYVSFSDYRTREVSNSVWLFFAPPVFALTLTELFLYNPSDMLYYGISLGLTVVLATILFYSGGFGGADAKALMCLAIALPFYPVDLFSPLSGEISPVSQKLFPMAVLGNSVLLAAATVFYIFLRNILWHRKASRVFFEGEQRNESFGKKLLVLMTGYKVPINNLKEKRHLYPMEDLAENSGNRFQRKLVVIPRDEGRNAVVERLGKALEAGKIQDLVWATPGLPLLIFITVGLIVALFFGDVAWISVRFLLG